MGYKATMILSLFIQMVGAVMFLPAAHFVSFPLFLTAIFVVGAGVTMLQTCVNPYAANLGPGETAPVRVNLVQAANSLGGTIAPWIAGTFILTTEFIDPAKVAPQSLAAQHAFQVSIANTVRIPYIVVAVALAILGIAVTFVRLPHIQGEHRQEDQGGATQQRSIWSYRRTVLAALGIFFYVGTEVGLATTMVLYFSDATHGGLNTLTVPTAQKLVLFYWLGSMTGRLLSPWMLNAVIAGKLLGVFGITASLPVVISMFTTAYLAIAALILVGFFNSVQFPNIFTLGIVGLGPLTSRGSGLITTAIVGGALLPVAIGWLVDKSSYQLALILPVIAYLYIAWYGLSGSKQAKNPPAA